MTNEPEEAPDELRQHDEQYVEGIVTELLKHFDTVQIFVTRQEPDAHTVAVSIGRGNWYARYGQVAAWWENGGAMEKGEEEE
jgi:hypothetical protein